LAEHFESGKLTTKFLSEASVEDVSKALIDVRGIGQVRLIFILEDDSPLQTRR